MLEKLLLHSKLSQALLSDACKTYACKMPVRNMKKWSLLFGDVTWMFCRLGLAFLLSFTFL